MRINGRVVLWDMVGEGGYNRTYISKDSFPYEVNGVIYDQRWVRKIPKIDKQDKLYGEMNDPERAVRLWNELNPELPSVVLPENQGWLAPYLGSKKCTDDNVAQKQIEIYRNTRRIVADACGDGNFLSFDGEIICVDVDAAVHQSSPTSQRITSELLDSDYEDYWRYYAEKLGMQKSVTTTKTLLYLDSQLHPDEILDEHITSTTVAKLTRYQLRKIPVTRAVLDRLSSICPESQKAFTIEPVAATIVGGQSYFSSSQQNQSFFQPQPIIEAAGSEVKMMEVDSPNKEMPDCSLM
jgi:hypothetical protein